MTRCFEKLSCAALAFGLVVPTAIAEEKSAWRLFVSDHAAPVVRAIDAETGKVLANFATKGPATLHRSESGRTVFAVQGKSDVISVISSGISMGDHGDHGDIEIEAPGLLEVTFPGNKPSHFVDHHGDIALFFDGEGVVRTISEKDVLAGSKAAREIDTGAPHHGVAVAFGSHILVTEPNREEPDELPVGIQVIDSAGEPVGGVHSCPDLHGEASSGNLLAIACAEGLLLVKSGGDAPSIELLPYPSGLPEGKSTTLVGGRGLQYFLGNYGPSAVVLIDPTAEDAFRLIELPARRVHFAVDPIRPKFAYVFTEDGRLHRIDVLAGEIVGTVALTEPYSMDGHWSDPRPRIAVTGDSIVVSDPLKGVLHRVDPENFAAAGAIPANRSTSWRSADPGRRIDGCLATSRSRDG